MNAEVYLQLLPNYLLWPISYYSSRPF